jgi:ClpP class serine protease
MSIGKKLFSREPAQPPAQKSASDQASSARATVEQIRAGWARAKNEMQKAWPRRGRKLLFVIHEGDDGISNEDATDVVSEINMMKKPQGIDVIIHSPGGGATASERIAEALIDRRDTAAFVPFYAWSGGTKIALATERIYFAKGASLSPMDIQIETNLGVFAARTLIEQAKRDDAPPDLRIVAATAEKLIRDEEKKACALINRCHKGGAWWGRGKCELAQKLTSGELHHGHRIGMKQAKDLGIRVEGGMPGVVYDFINRRREQLRKLRELEYQVTFVQVSQPPPQ